MDLYGGIGSTNGDNAGGEGGYSRIRFTMEQDKEYVIAGLIVSVNAPFLYREGTLIACVGQGGDGGWSGINARGGFGGGVDVSGRSGQGRFEGLGGRVIAAGGLSGNGKFGGGYQAPVLYPGDTQGSSAEGGQTISCTKGVYWAQQGLAPCATTTTKFRLADGTEVSNTMTLTRGFKAGYNIMQTGAADRTHIDGGGGGGGNGATGGSEGGTGGGGGGSGYQDGSVTVVDTQLGGSTGNAKVVLRVVT